MWIRSQNKKHLMKVKDLHINAVFAGDKCIIYEILNDDYSIGDYKTEDRCIKVLNAIQEELMYYNHYSHSGENSSMCQDYHYGVFQMPDDES